VLIDVTRLLNRALAGRLPTGVDRVGLAYLHHFGHRARMVMRIGGQWFFLNQSDSEGLRAWLLTDAPEKPMHAYWKLLRGCMKRPGEGVRSSLFFNTGHSGLERSDYGKYIVKYNLKPVFFLHDLIPLQYPEYCRPVEADKHEHRLRLMLSLGQGIIVNSRSTLLALREYAASRHVSLPPCAVAPLAPGLTHPLEGDARITPLLDVPYFVMVGTIEPRKNHLLILNLWRELAQELGEGCPRLVLTGQRGWECEQVVDMLERCPALKPVLIQKTACSDSEMKQWLIGARALLFPSFAEGFGMPLVEALLLRVPVLASRLEVFEEIAGSIPDYMHPLDAVSWKRVVLDYTQDASMGRRAQLLRMEGYAPPDWHAHFNVVEEFIERLGEQSSS
jgi:glycosyltransferase involved in cell wall biosynthesis